MIPFTETRIQIQKDRKFKFRQYNGSIMYIMLDGLIG